MRPCRDQRVGRELGGGQGQVAGGQGTGNKRVREYQGNLVSTGSHGQPEPAGTIPSALSPSHPLPHWHRFQPVWVKVKGSSLSSPSSSCC